MSLGNFLIPVGSLPPSYEGADNLINGAFPQVRVSIQICKDESDLKRGSLLGMVTEGQEKGHYRLIKAEAKDGSASPQCVLADDYKSAQAMPVTAYLSGQFNMRSLIVGAGISPADLVPDLRKISIFVTSSIARPKL